LRIRPAAARPVSVVSTPISPVWSGMIRPRRPLPPAARCN